MTTADLGERVATVEAELAGLTINVNNLTASVQKYIDLQRPSWGTYLGVAALLLSVVATLWIPLRSALDDQRAIIDLQMQKIELQIATTPPRNATSG